MADEETKTTNKDEPTPAIADTTSPDGSSSDTAGANSDNVAAIMSETASRIAEAHNILIALSSDPSVDELSAAIGLSICLDRVGKRATAIYSGGTPNALEFLKPEDTFESSADTLQDFVIAINKDKADHLRYKLDGDYVRIYITPYKSRISEEDLEYSYGDFNIDLVLALNVANGTDLDGALREHGRIMHDASIINITTGNPGKFGEIEWSDKTRSSVSEMVAELLFGMKKVPVEKEEATAFLTGIVAATNRFSNASTTSDTMQIASKLMEAGANQQLISENLTGDTDNQMFSFNNDLASKHEEDATSLDIEHNSNEEENSDENTKSDEEADSATTTETSEDDSNTTGPNITPESTGDDSQSNATSTDDELQAIADSLSGNNIEATTTKAVATEPSSGGPVTLTPSAGFAESIQPAEQPSLAPSDSFVTDNTSGEGSNKYGQMLEAALAEDMANTTPISTPITSTPGMPEPGMEYFAASTQNNTANPIQDSGSLNPAASLAPDVAPSLESSSVPSLDYEMVTPPSTDVLPPPPAPPIDIGSDAIMPPSSTDASSTPAPASDASSEQPADLSSSPASAAAPADSSAFQIPGTPAQ